MKSDARNRTVFLYLNKIINNNFLYNIMSMKSYYTINYPLLYL